MKRKIFAFLLAFVIICSISACSGDENANVPGYEFCGTWKFEYAICDGTKVYASQLKSGDKDFGNTYYVISEDGSVWFVFDGEALHDTWTATETGIKISSSKNTICIIDNCLTVKDGNKITYCYKKTSDKQNVD